MAGIEVGEQGSGRPGPKRHGSTKKSNTRKDPKKSQSRHFTPLPSHPTPCPLSRAVTPPPPPGPSHSPASHPSHLLPSPATAQVTRVPIGKRRKEISGRWGRSNHRHPESSRKERLGEASSPRNGRRSPCSDGGIREWARAKRGPARLGANWLGADNSKFPACSTLSSMKLLTGDNREAPPARFIQRPPTPVPQVCPIIPQSPVPSVPEAENGGVSTPIIHR